MKKTSKIVVAVAFVFELLFSGIAFAEEKTGFSLELNGAKDSSNGCRLTYVAYNGTGKKLDKTAYEVVVFNKEGGVSQFLILEFGKLPLKKTKVVQFDLKETKCADISRLLINDVSDCIVGGVSVSTCMDELKTKSRTAIGFGT